MASSAAHGSRASRAPRGTSAWRRRTASIPSADGLGRAGVGQRHAAGGDPGRRSAPHARARRTGPAAPWRSRQRPGSTPDASGGRQLRAGLRPRRLHRRRGRVAEGPRRRHRRHGRLHDHPRAGRVQHLPRADREHPPVPAPGLPGGPRGARRPGLRREGHRVHRPPGHRAGGPRPDPGPGGGARPPPRRRGHPPRAHQGRRTPPLPAIIEELLP